MTKQRPPTTSTEPAESFETVQLLVADTGNRSAISGMLDGNFEVETSQTVTDADLYLIEDHLFPEYRAALRGRVEREHPAFCPIVLIRRESTDLRQGGLGPSAPDAEVRYDEVVDAPINPPQLIRRLDSLLVRRRQSRELQQQLSTLKEREQRLRRFEQGVESTGNGIVMTDPTGTIEYVNPALEAMVGYTEDEVLEESPRMLLPEGTGEVFDEAFWRTMADSAEWEGDIVIERKDSQRRVVNATTTALRDVENEPEGFVIVLSDITDRIQRRQELEDREEELDLLRQILTRYLRHNLRNDLNVIQGNAQLLKDDETLSPEQRRLTETIIENSQSLIEKSDTARTYSRLLEREDELSSFDLSEIATNAVHTVRESYPAVDFDIDVPERCTIQAREGIQRAFVELIENAAKHNDTPEPWVRVRVEKRDGARLVIEDNGPGIPDQERASLERGSETNLSHSQGVGLWLSKWVIEGIDGRISIEPTEAGTHITVALPPSRTVGSSGLEVTTLKERERRLQTITDRMTDAILEVDADWNITRLDERAERILDVDGDAVLGQDLWDEFAGLRGSDFEVAVRDAMESRSSSSLEEEFPKLGAWLEINVYPEFGGGLSFYTRDVTERKEREKTLETERRKFESLTETVPSVIYRLDPDTMEATFVNDSIEDLHGYTPEEWTENPGLWKQTLHPEDRDDVVETFRNCQEEKRSGELEYRIVCADGDVRWIRDTFDWERAEDGSITALVGVDSDITALKERERELQERVKELSAIHSTTDLFRTVDAPVEELLSEFVETIPQSLQYPELTAARLRYNGMEVSTAEFESRDRMLTARATLEDGSEIELDVVYLSDSRKDGEDPFLAEERALLDTLVTVVKNHLQRRTYLRELERTEELLTNAEVLGDVGAWEVDLETQDVVWTDGARRIHGVTEEFELTLEVATEFFHPEDRDRVTDAVETCAASGEPFTLEARIRTTDDDERWIHIEGEPLETGEPPYIVRGYIQDITDRKERNRRYEAIFNQTYQFTGLMEPDGTLIEANDSALEFGGITRADVLGKKVWNAHWFEISTETQRETKAAVRKAATGEFVRRELEVQGADSTLVIDFSIRPITDEDGTVVLLVPEGRDITELKEQERRREQIIDRVTDAIVEVDSDWRFTLVNEQAEALYGMDEEYLLGRDFWSVFEEAKGTTFEEEYRGVMETRDPTSFVEYFSQLDGWFDIEAYPKDDGGIEFYFVEVTEQYERKRELEETNEFLSTLFETIPAGVVVLDTNGRITRANSYAERELGLVESEITDRTYRDPAWEIFDEDGESIPDEELPFSRVMETGEMVVDYEHGIERPDGSRRWLAINAAPIIGEDGTVESVIAVIVDETERRE